MSSLRQAGRPAKSQLTCNACKGSCSPKNGDWFATTDGSGGQIFLCKPCEAKRPRAGRSSAGR